MGPIGKRKIDWDFSSLFTLPPTKKAVLHDPPADAFSYCKSESNENETPIKQVKKSRIAAFRRTGSRVLYALSLRSQNRTCSSAASPTLISRECDIASPVIGNLVKEGREGESRHDAGYLDRERILCMEGHQDLTVRLPRATHGIVDPFAAGPEYARIVPLHVHQNRRGSGLLHSRSMPGLAYELSHKLSNSFGNPTVIHRPKLRPGVSIPMDVTTRFGPASPDSGSTIPNSNGSSFQNGRSQSFGPALTPMTSLESDQASATSTGTHPEAAMMQPLSSVANEEIETPLVPIFGVPLVQKPTIKTVELTAIAKTFFETHYNSILSSQETPRSQRRLELELKLDSQPLSTEAKEQQRRLWIQQESDFLRQTRVLKSRRNYATGRRGVSLAGYEVIRILGKGSFGVVRLVRESNGPCHVPDTGRSLTNLRPSPDDRMRYPGEVYAMKVIRKSDMLRSSQEAHLRAERDFLVASERSRWVVPLIASFQDHTNLYLVMDYMIGGDFLGLLIKYDRLEERKAVFYVAEMILCLEETHRLGWIHRDVKPDNFLISASGHLKISDFGLAFDGHWAHDQSYYNNHRYSLLEKLGISVKGDAIDRAEDLHATAGRAMADILMGEKERQPKNRHERPSDDEHLGRREGILQWRNRHGKRALARSVVGTSQYMAPEVIRVDEYDGRCDWWSLGIIMYESLYGETPFIGRDRQTTKLNILRHDGDLRFVPNRKLEWRHRISREAKDLMNRLVAEKEQRLCSGKYRINDFDRFNAACSPLDEARDHRGHFVYPDDASDIRAHPFFQGVDWEHLHLTRPPEVPKVKHGADTKYFDQEAPISDVDDNSTTESLEEDKLAAQEEFEKEIAAAFEREMKTDADARGPAEKAVDPLEGMPIQEGANARKAKEKKRPRDKILRDRTMAREALELRKRGAFLGYSYRRPRTILATIGNGGERPPLPEQS